MSKSTAERVSEMDHDRAKELFKQRRKEGAASRVSTESFRLQRRQKFVGLSLGRQVRGYSSGVALGDAVRRQMMASIAREQHIKDTVDRAVIHVKDGKPLTEYGAKVLGVGWPLDEGIVKP